MKDLIKKNFESACLKIDSSHIERTTIGTLGEKCLHLILKYSFEPEDKYHEIKIGSFYADIKNEQGITEIHTGNFNTLRRKLDVFLINNSVRIVYPIPRVKYITWIDNESGELSTPRKSPKFGSYFDCFRELYKIKTYLTNPNLIFTPVLIDVMEYRNLDGWSKDGKKGSSRFDRVPTDLCEYIDIKSVNDYKNLIPEGIDLEFTVKDFAKAAKISEGSASKAINILKYIGVIVLTGKRGRAFTYSVVNQE